MRLSFIPVLLVLTACSRTTEGPIPSLTGAVNPLQRFEVPAPVCNAQGDEGGWRINLIGERFTPAPQDVLTGEPQVALPQVTLKGAVTLTMNRRSVLYRDSTLLFLDIPTKHSLPRAELPPGNYAIEVKNPGGGSASVENLLVVVPPPTVTGVTAPQGFTFTGPSPLIIEGTGFRPGTFPVMKLRRQGAEDVDIFVSTVDSATRITAELPSGTPEGTYEFTLANPEGCEASLPNALTITYARLGALTIKPRFGWQRRNQAITIHNAAPGTEGAFTPNVPEVSIVAPLKTNPAERVNIPLNRVAFVSPNVITAEVPTCSGTEALPLTDPNCPNGIVPGGPYALWVADTSGVGEVPAARGFAVLENEPVIDPISPTEIDTRGWDNLVVLGNNFGAGAKVQLLKQLSFTGNILECDLPPPESASSGMLIVDVPPLIPAAQCVESTSAGTQVPATGDLKLIPGLYVVRVQRTEDPGSADFASLTVTDPMNSLSLGAPVSARLTTARADFPLVAAANDQGQRFLYALGGTDGTQTLASVEVAPVNAFGEVGGDCASAPCTFQALERTPLTEARRGLAAVVQTVPNDTSYLYVLGGVRGSDGATLATVERAQVLKGADAPVLAPPERLSDEGGMLPPGAFYYRVSAILDSTDEENPNGETLPSEEYPVKANAALKSARLTWKCVPGAAKYRIYRTATANERSGAERLLEELAAPATPACTGSPLPEVSYVDMGTKAPAANAPRPLPPGALGNWVGAGVPQLGVARGNAAVRLVGDRLYVSGGFCSEVGPGCPSANATLASVELGLFAPSRPELQPFKTVGMLTHPRQRHSMAIANASTAPSSFTSSSPDNALDEWLVVVGGDQGGSPHVGTRVIEVGRIRQLGDEVDPLSFTESGYSTAGTHGGWTEIIANSLFQAGTHGGSAFTLNYGFVCPGPSGPGQCGIPNTAPYNFQGTIISTSLSYQQGGARYLVGSTLLTPFIFAAGGFPSDAGGTPTATLERLTH